MTRSMGRSCHDSVSVTDVVTRVAMTYQPVRPWREHWRRVERYHLRVRAIYDGTAPGNSEDWKDVIFDFFVAAHHLFEWIESDPREPLVVAPVAREWVKADQSLWLAREFSNTYKHHTRSTGVPVRIGGTITERGQNSMVIEWLDPISGVPNAIDALDLADRCMQAWRNFFVLHGLNPAG
ncbi:hypothetical protein [Dactylosporangium sp. NPDC006015]|uniref:hypothetical protein n=1 Tax=Dactylosporangium sp. NPDC006015 TaxID=3154576 RepID=UPI0033B46B90